MNVVLTILGAVLVFGAVIFFHELGHFIAAKSSGIKVNEFALGMGPTLFKIVRGETTYALRLLPIGGFVSMEGEDEESSDEHSFQRVPIWRRVIVTIAGAFMNVVLCLVLLILLVSTGSPYWAGREIALVENESLGLQVGDVITHINGRRAFTFSDLDYEFLRTQNGTFDITVKRDGEKVVLEDVAFDTEVLYEEDGSPVMNEATGEPFEMLVFGFKVYRVDKSVGTVLQESFNTTLSYSRLIYLSLFDLVTGRTPINQLSGPVGIVSEISRAVAVGWRPLANLMALISINLAVVNMLPLPALDGGRTLLLIVEAIRRKPIPQKYEAIINVAGFALLMCLMLVISFNDIRRLIM